MYQHILIQTILEYESDTFSAAGSNISEEEAEKVAESIINGWIENNLDGVIISSALDEIRGED